ncbi:MAG: hypothetical protein FJ279_21630, partial [Planctomycetes bacterium]|nr:hypothetical protein [Planctomycetota bacterium]
MTPRSALMFFMALLTCRAALADWSLYDSFDRVLVYDGMYFKEYAYGPQDIKGAGGGRLMWAVFPKPEGGSKRLDAQTRIELKPYAEGMGIQGELRPGQVLLSGESVMTPAVVEFVVRGGRRIELEYGLC